MRRSLCGLGLQSQAGEGKNFISFPQRGVAVNHDVGMKLATAGQHGVFTHHAIGADQTVLADLRPSVNNRRRVDGLHYWSMSMKVTSASLTGSPSTEHTPLALPIFPRALVISTSMTRVSPGRTGLRHFTLSAAMK